MNFELQFFDSSSFIDPDILVRVALTKKQISYIMAESSGFKEIQNSNEISPARLEANTSEMQDFDKIEEIPFDDVFSWNPIDWVTGIQHEIATFSLEMSEKKRVVSIDFKLDVSRHSW